MECKNALKETEGDIAAAIKYLRERGDLKAAKKADRAAKEGVVAAQLSEDGKSGILVEVNCETDFVARNENFQAFVDEVASTVAASDAQDLDAALALPKGDQTLEGRVRRPKQLRLQFLMTPHRSRTRRLAFACSRHRGQRSVLDQRW